MSENPLQPLAEALLAARRPDGTWPEPLDWLAEQVMEQHGSDCVPVNSVALQWPDEWARGTVWKLCSLLWEQLPTVAGEVEDKVWYDADFFNILVEAVKAIAEAAHAAS